MNFWRRREIRGHEGCGGGIASTPARIDKINSGHGTYAALQHLGWAPGCGGMSRVIIMPRLTETTAFLKRQRSSPAAAASGRDRKGLMKETSRFGANPGSLRMLSYVPENLPPSPPLVVVLHGCTQRGAAYAEAAGWLSLADRCGFAVIAPEQSQSNNSNRCFNWFEPGDARRGQGEAASIRGMVASAVRQHGLDPSRVFVTGLSAGGAMTAVMLATYPEVFAAGAIIAGLPYGVATNLQEALGAMHAGRSLGPAALGELVRRAAPPPRKLPRVSIWHGDADATVRPHNATDLAQQWAAAHGATIKPTETQQLSGRTRGLWRDEATGEVLVETTLIHGMAHGAPLSTAGPDGVGVSGPYMLEVGVSSSVEIARFWSIPVPSVESESPQTRPPRPVQAARGRRRKQTQRDDHRSPPQPLMLGDRVMDSVSPYVSKDVRSIIAKALKTAGLKS